MGHEFIGVVDAVGADVQTVKRRRSRRRRRFKWSDGTCVFCREGLQSECLHGGRYGFGDVDGGQGEAVRVPQADGTLVVLPVDRDDALMPSLLALTDVMGTGHHAARAAEVGPGKTSAVIGDGAVGLCGVIAASRLGAEQIIMLGRHPARIALAREFGATDVVSERGEEAIERVRELTGGFGAHSVLECVGLPAGGRHGARDRASGRRRRSRRRPSGGHRPGWHRLLEERQRRRRPRAGACVHRGTAPGRARRAGSSRAASSTGRSGSTGCLTATGR